MAGHPLRALAPPSHDGTDGAIRDGGTDGTDGAARLACGQWGSAGRQSQEGSLGRKIKNPTWLGPAAPP